MCYDEGDYSTDDNYEHDNDSDDEKKKCRQAI
jgi:hypothetical protein